MTQRAEDLAAARRLLLALSEGLVDEGRATARMHAEVAVMRKRVRKVHNAAVAAEGDSTVTGENR
ncbi:hypothetical protein [Promicromonospora iranensis]|uniref:hypothetical protein n=1 Tax=Promicromonospora iranensis TaxID=1105144 RepID=UPI0023AA0B88|nr:hypothetical protein [Promicromonospora iranensis]